MLRVPGAQLDLPTRHHSGANGYSKTNKREQSLKHRIKVAMQQITTAELCLSVSLMSICLGLAWLLVINTNQAAEEYRETRDNPHLNTAPMDRDISGFQQQQANIFAKLEPVFDRFSNVQAESEERRKAIDQLHTDIHALSDLMVQAGYNSSHELPVLALMSAPGRTLAQQTELWRSEQTTLQQQLKKAQAAAKQTTSEQQTLAMQIRMLRKQYQDKAIGIRWANRRKARLLGTAASPSPSLAAGAVAAPVKRLALDHDLSKPVPKAVEVAATENELDADLSALYQERAHVGQGSEAVADLEPVLEASNEAVLVAGKEPTVERHEEANEQEPVENAPGTEHRQEHVIQLTDQQQGADSRHAAPDIKTSQEAANQEPAEEDSSIFVREVKAQQAPVIVDKQQPVVKLADKQQGADPVEEAPTIELSKKVENDAVQGSAGQHDKVDQTTQHSRRASPFSVANGRQEDTQQDDSVRCRMSNICEGASACGQGDELGCITDTATRQEHIREAMKWSWKGYRAFAWGQDELLPHSHSSNRWFGLGLTLVDSLDTLHIMGLEPELAEAREWVARNLILDQDSTVNLFETTIRILGGLLSAFFLTGGDQVYLYKAVELGMRMTPGFHSPSGIPWSDVNLQSLKGTPPQWSADSSLSEVTSLTLEYYTLGQAMGHTDLSKLASDVVTKVGKSGDLEQGVCSVWVEWHGHPDLGKLARDVVTKVGKSGDCDEGVCPVWANPHSGRIHGDILSLGSRGDSYYEYLLKHWILTGKSDQALLKQYVHAVKGVRSLLLMRTSPAPDGLLYIAERRRRKGNKDPKMDHLVCFLPGLLALGHFHGVNTGAKNEPNDLEVAKDLMFTCYQMYSRIPAGLSPEIVFFIQHDQGEDYPKQHHMDVGSGDFMVKQQDSHNLLRPETVESLFILHQVTGDPQYQEWGWHVFRAFEKFSKVDSGGYANLDSVLSVPPPQRDKMESFWTGEALKYLYLLLDPSPDPRFPLDQWVFNTEAHPLPVQGSAAEEAVKTHFLNSAEMMTHRLTGYREHDHLAEWVQEWQGLDAAHTAQQFPASRKKRSLFSLSGQ